jgi:hypothetical protein
MIDDNYLDQYEMITTIEKDGGDSAFHEGHYYSMLELTGNLGYSALVDYSITATQLQNDEGNIRRHPDESKWYGDWDRGSRDQSIPLLISFFLTGSMRAARNFFKAHLKRALLFATNNRRNGSTAENHGKEYYPGRFRDYSWKPADITGPVFWSIYIRGFRNKLLYPLLLIFDLFLLVNTITFNISPREPNQHLLLLFFSKRSFPTPFSYIAYKLLNKEKVKNELRSYWYSTSHGNGYWRPYFIGQLYLDKLGE